MKNGFFRYSVLRKKSEISDEKLEGKIGPVMEVHMDANRTLSQLSYRPIVTYAVKYVETGENTYSKSTCCIIADFFKK